MLLDIQWPLHFFPETDFIYNDLHIVQKWTKTERGKLKIALYTISSAICGMRIMSALYQHNEEHKGSAIKGNMSESNMGRTQVT